MEFPFFTAKALNCDDDGFAIIDGGQPHLYRRPGAGGHNPLGGGATAASTPAQQMEEIIDRMGAASAKAQKLPQVITTTGKLFASDNRLYLQAVGKAVVGLLKVGKRNLFINGGSGQIKEIKPLCVLDFYVHESVQRGGHGRALFAKMLQAENARPEKLGYDRPSEKLIAFCGRHFGLRKYVPQNNNFVVFDAYWDASRAGPGAGPQSS